MVKRFAILSLALGITIPAALVAGEAVDTAPGPCKQIVEACAAAGFVRGDAKEGYGLWADCVDPIMRGTAQPSNADKPLPSVSPELVAACKQKRPNFAEGKKNSPAK